MSDDLFQEIRFGGELLAILVKRKFIDKLYKTTIFTPDKWRVQVGYNVHKSKDIVPSHYHIRGDNKSGDIGVEALYVIKGSIKVYIYHPKSRALVSSFIADEGDLVIMKSGHKIEYLKDSILLQVKEGPYPGMEKDKVKI